MVLGELGSNLHDLEKAVFYYLLGGYFKLYNSPLKKSKMLLLGAAAITLLIINGVLQYNIYSNSDTVILRKFFSMISIMIEPLLVSSIFYLLISFNIGANNFINKLASCTFGVYLLHGYPYTGNLLWNYYLHADEHFASGGTFLAYSIAVVTAVFLIGAVIDILRQKFIEKFLLNVISQIEEKFKKSFLGIEATSK